MRRNLCLAVTLLGLLLAVGLRPAPGAEAEGRSRVIRIGVVNTLAKGVPSSLLAIVMRPFKTYMESQTGTTGEIVSGGDAFALGKKLNDNKLQVGVFHGHEFAWAREKYPNLQPIAVCINQLRSVRVHLVVAKDNAGTTYTDLEGKTVAIPKNSREHARLYFERRCVKPGMSAEKFYRKLTIPTDAEEALDDVVAGRAQAAVVDVVSLEAYRKARPEEARSLRSMQESEPFPPGVIAYCKDCFSAADVKRFRTALLDAKSNPRGRQTLQVLKLTGFERAPADYETSLKTIAKAYPAPAER